jgi:hypothetical protein
MIYKNIRECMLWLSYACFIRRILVASNAIKTINNEMINLIKLHYLFYYLIRRDRDSTYKTGINCDVISCVSCHLINHGSRPMKALEFLPLLYIKRYYISYYNDPTITRKPKIIFGVSRTLINMSIIFGKINTRSLTRSLISDLLVV